MKNIKYMNFDLDALEMLLCRAGEARLELLDGFLGGLRDAPEPDGFIGKLGWDIGVKGLAHTRERSEWAQKAAKARWKSRDDADACERIQTDADACEPIRMDKAQCQEKRREEKRREKGLKEYRPSASSPAATLLGDEMISETPKNGKPRAKSWQLTFPEDVREAVLRILEKWPDPKRGDSQPGARDPTPVPVPSGPDLARRLVEIKKQGGDLEVCEAIADRAIEEWKGGKWIKAPQFFFGVAKDAPWQAYYQAEITNRSLECAD